MTLNLGEPPVISLLESNPQYSKEIYAIRENAIKPAQEAIRRGETEKAVRIFMYGYLWMNKANTKTTSLKRNTDTSFVLSPC